MLDQKWLLFWSKFIFILKNTCQSFIFDALPDFQSIKYYQLYLGIVACMRSLITTILVFIAFMLKDSYGQVMALQGISPYFETGRRALVMPSRMFSSTRGFSVYTRKVRIGFQKHRRPFVALSSTSKFASSVNRRYFLFAQVVVRSTTRFKIRLTIKYATDGVRSWSLLSAIKFDYMAISSTFPNIYISSMLDVIRGNTNSYPKGIGQQNSHKLNDWVGVTPFPLTPSGVRFVWGVIYVDTESMNSDNRFGLYLSFKILNTVEFQTNLNSVYSIRIRQFKISLLIYDVNAFDTRKILLRDSRRVVPAFGVNTPPQTLTLDGWPNFAGMQVLTGLAGFQFTTAKYFAFESSIKLPVNPTVQITLYVQNLAPTIAIPKIQITYLTVSQLTCPNKEPFLDSTLTICLTACPAGSTPSTAPYGMTGLYQCSPCSGSNCCAAGTYWSGSACLTCLANCAICSTSTNCIVCNTGYALDLNDVCTLIPTCALPCTQCEGLLCIACIAPYEVEGGTCLCPDDMTLSGSSCASCTATLTNCLSCDTSTTCEECNGMYYLTSSFTCARCVAACEVCTNSSVCIQCSIFATLQANDLCTCDTGSYMDTTTQLCVPCNPGCIACTKTQCTQCADAAHVKTGTQCICPMGYYTDQDLTCVLCTGTYLNCAECNSTECFICTTKFYLAVDNLSCLACPSSCSSCTSPTVCTACEASFVLDSASSTCNCAPGSFFDGGTSSCSPCILVNCLECVSLTQCTVCASGFYLLTTTNNCVSCNGSFGPTCTSCTSSGCAVCTNPTTISTLGICECPIGQTFSGSICVACASNIFFCSTCTSTSVCTNCITSYYLQSPTSCQPCPTGCLQCTSPVCSQCFPTFIKDLSGNCVCPVGTYFDGASTCLSCNSAMAGCTECASSTVCAVCTTAYYQPIGSTTCTACTPNCVQCDDSGCLTCQNGFVSSFETATSKTICQDCKLMYGISCLSCDLSKCTFCDVDFFWLPTSNQCVSIDLLECGDSFWIEQYEACDDGNLVNGDGCDSMCHVEIDYECRPQDKLLTGESLCVFTKDISIAFDRLQKETSSNVVNLILKAEPSTFMQWTPQTIKALLGPIQIVNQQTGTVSVIPLNSVNILFTRDELTNEIKVVIDYGQNNLEGSSLKFNLNPLATNLSSLKYTSLQSNLFLPIDNSQTGVYLYGYSEETYAAQAMISSVCTGIGLMALILGVVGMFIPTGKILIIEALAVVQITFFSVLQYQKIPPTFIGFKDLILSNGYNDQKIAPQTTQQSQDTYKLMGLSTNALSNYNISLVLFVVMPTVIGGVGLLVNKFLAKSGDAPRTQQPLPTNETTVNENGQQKNQKQEPIETQCKGSLKHSRAQSIIDKLNSSRFNNDLQSPSLKNSADKLHKVSMDQNLLNKKDNSNSSTEKPLLQNISFSKLILQRIFYENTFYGLFMTSYLAWVSTFSSFSNFEVASIAVILPQFAYLIGFGIMFVKQAPQRVSLDLLLGKQQKQTQAKAPLKQSQNVKKMSVSTKFGQFNQLCMQKLQNPCNPSLKNYSKLSLLFLAQRLVSSLCLALLAQSMAFAGAIITTVYVGLLATIIVVNKKLCAFEQEERKKVEEQNKQEKEDKPAKVFIEIIQRPKSQIHSQRQSFSIMDFFFQNYVFRQGMNFATIIIIQLLFLFANMTMSDDPYETFVSNSFVTKLIPFISLGLISLNMLFNTFLLFVEIKQGLLPNIKNIIDHYFPSNNQASKPSQSNANNQKSNQKDSEENESLKSQLSRSQKQEDQVVNMLNKFLQKSEMLQTKESPFIGIEEKGVKIEALKNLFKIQEAHKVKMSEAGKDIRNKLITQMWDQI